MFKRHALTNRPTLRKDGRLFFGYRLSEIPKEVNFHENRESWLLCKGLTFVPEVNKGHWK